MRNWLRMNRTEILIVIAVASIFACAILTRADQRIEMRPIAVNPTVQMLVCPPRGITLDAVCSRVIDGDTIVCRTVIQYRVRLLDCWAPESRTKDLEEKRRGIAAKERLISLAERQPVRVHVPSTGSLSDIMTFDRVLGHVWLIDDAGNPESSSLNARQVADGFATPEKSQQ